MTPFLQLAFSLVVILVAAKLAGYLTSRLGQPSVLGELLVGVLLGPSLLDITHIQFITDAHLGEVLSQLGELGVLLLMFIAGLELHFSELARNTRVSALSGTFGVVLPVALGYAVGTAFGMRPAAAGFLGLALGATSVSISAQTLMELGVLRSRVGLGLLGAAVFDDILVILLLSGFLAFTSGQGGVIEILVIFLRMLVFLGASFAFGLWLLPWLERRIVRLQVSQGALTLALVVMLVYAIAAETLGGMAAITGAFLAGLMFARTPEKSRIEPGLLALAYSLFVPVFFVTIGLDINLRTLQISTLWLLLAISTIAILTKIAGAGLGARAGGFSWREAVQLGAGMVSRGEVGLIVTSIGLREAIVDNTEFSAVVGMVLVTTLVTPPLLRWLIPPKKEIRPASVEMVDIVKPADEKEAA
jgi:Kef-type K+ transport system membrane component KefB